MRANPILYFSFVALGVLAYFLQSMTILSSDVSSLLYDTKLFLAGGTYVTDFFETNPPMIFFIYSPVVLFAKISGMPTSVLVRLYTALLALLSITCCQILLKNILNKDDDKLRYVIFFILTFVFLFLPNSDFGQREHFLLIFMMPYLFAAVLTAQGKPIHPGLAVLIGVMAGFGFGLKPFFLPALVFVELYLIFARRSIMSCFRIESVICASMLLIYLAYIFLVHPNYIHIMLPLLFTFYFPSIKESWFVLLTDSTTIFCFILLGYYLIFYNKKHYPELTAILILAFCGMIVAFVLPRTLWWSHLLPVVGLSCLLVAIFIYQLFYEKIKKGLISNKELSLLIAIGLLMPLMLCVERAILIVNYNKSFNSNPFIQSLRQANSQSVYCIARGILCFPLLQDTKHEFAGRFPLLWWINGLLQMEKNSGLTALAQQQKNFLMNVLIEDLNQQQPQTVIVRPTTAKNSFDMLKYLLQDEKFQQVWSQYRYVDTFDDLMVYERINSVHQAG